MTESISIIGLLNDNNFAKVTVISHVGSCLNGLIQKFEYKNTQEVTKVCPTEGWWQSSHGRTCEKGYPLYVKRIAGGTFQGFTIDPKKTLTKMFDKFTAAYAYDDKIIQLFFLNSRIQESETVEEVGMEEGAQIECFNFLNFFLRKDSIEIDGCISLFTLH